MTRIEDKDELSADARVARKRARVELLAAVGEFDTKATVANVRLVNAIEDMILAMVMESASSGIVSGRAMDFRTFAATEGGPIE